MQDEKLPAVNMVVGDKFTDVVENSTYNFTDEKVSRMRDDSLFDIQEPVEFHYVDGDYSFTPPAPSHLVWINQKGNIIHEVTVTIPLKALDLAGVYNLAMKTINTINQTTWEVNPDRTAVSLERLAEIYASSRTNRGYAMPLQEWRNGDVKMILSVKRINQAGTVKFGMEINEDTYIVDLYISNSILNKRLIKPLSETRRKINGSNEKLPLKYWIDNDAAKQVE